MKELERSAPGAPPQRPGPDDSGMLLFFAGGMTTEGGPRRREEACELALPVPPASATPCACPSQLQPHDRYPGACEPSFGCDGRRCSGNAPCLCVDGGDEAETERERLMSWARGREEYLASGPMPIHQDGDPLGG